MEMTIVGIWNIPQTQRVVGMVTTSYGNWRIENSFRMYAFVSVSNIQIISFSIDRWSERGLDFQN